MNDNLPSGAELLQSFRRSWKTSQFWAGADASHLAMLTAVLTADTNRRTRLTWALLAASVLLVVAAGRWLPGVLERENVILCIAAFVIPMLVVMVKVTDLQRDDAKLLWLLAPLNTRPQDCLQAVQLLRFDAVRTFRDQVIARPRELTRGDFWVMQSLGHAQATRECAPQDACRFLHEVPTAAA